MWIVWLEKKILKLVGIILAIVIILVTALHIYVVNNAERLIEDLVESKSNGKLKLKLKNIRFNYFSKKVQLDGVRFFSNDSLDLNTAYHFEVDKIRLQVKALIPIFTRKELKIDSIYLSAPKIEVIRLKPLVKAEDKQVSIPREMGRIYNSMMEALSLLEVKRFEFDEGRFTLINKIDPAQLPLVIDKLHFHIDNFKVDSLHTDDQMVTEQMVFRTRRQDITFPDGNHRLAFSRFRINIRKELIEIDSCTIAGKSNSANRSGFSVFFDTLKLTTVDFKSLYEKELIKADSVYCVNPDFKIDFELKDKKRPGKNAPNLDTLINQLTGDLQLNYVGVKNAAVNITTHRNDVSSTFTSDKNNFEMTGLLIDHSRAEPVSLESFDMAIRNYETFLKDSSYFLRFDSIRLRERKILLSNFSINTDPYKDTRNVKVQQFVLSGLSWADLLFERKIVAQQATLVRPQIDYVQTRVDKRKKKGPLASSLAGIDNIMHLEKIQVEKGTIKIKTLGETEVLLEDASVSLFTDDIFDSLSAENLQSETEYINFKKGRLKTRNLVFNFEDVALDGKTRTFQAEKMRMYNHLQTFYLNAKNFRIDSVYFDEQSERIVAHGIHWTQADAEVNPLAENAKPKSSKPVLDFKNISAENTSFNLNSIKGSFSVFLNSLSVASFEKEEKLTVNSFAANGKKISWYNQDISVSADSFALKDHTLSSFSALSFRQNKGDNLTELNAASISFIPDISSILAKSPDIKQLKITNPNIKIDIGQQNVSGAQKALPDISIDDAEIINPLFVLNSSHNKIKSISWNGNGNTIFFKTITAVKKENLVTAGSLKTVFSDFSFTDSLGKNTKSNRGEVNVAASELFFKPGEKPAWGFMLKELSAKNFRADSVGKNLATVVLQKGEVKNFEMRSSYSNDLKKLIENNPLFAVKNFTASIDDIKNKWRIYNISYSNPGKFLQVDSFSFHPQKNREEFISESPFQADYMTLRTGSVKAKNFSIDQYLQDSSFRMHTLAIDAAMFTSYRDKRPPFNAGIIKPLAAKLIQQIPVKISIDTILITNGHAVYTEFNDKTNEAGVVPLTRISGDIFPIKNFDISPTDSLRIRLNFYLLDSAWVRLRTRESYLDSLSGFLITLRMRPRSLLYLNEILPPLASVKLQSGYLDTLTMRAVGKDYLSLGKMQMYYRNLKVQFLKNGQQDKKRFLQGLITFIANSFVIKNENKKRVGVVYFPRLRDRSFINYYIKIAMSGIASSVGAKKNKRLMRKYKKQLQQLKLPPIDYD
jgi:hypothetical protein